MPTPGQTIYIRHGQSFWRKAIVVSVRGGELIAQWQNLLLRPGPGMWKTDGAEWQ